MFRQVNRRSELRDNQPGDDFKSRLVKMIPGEVVAAYLACNTAITQFGGDKEWYWVILGIILIVLPFYLTRVMNITDKVQIILMCIAFVIWCTTLEKPFDQWLSPSSKRQLVSTLALTLFTFIVPIFYKGVPPERQN